jgi:hypothetical protein
MIILKIIAVRDQAFVAFCTCDQPKKEAACSFPTRIWMLSQSRLSLFHRSRWLHNAPMRRLFVSRIRSVATSANNSSGLNDWPHPTFSSERLKDRKSTFLAHASSLSDANLFPQFLEYLSAQPELKRATHCMYAYRCQNTSSSIPTIGQVRGLGLACLAEEAIDNEIERWWGERSRGSYIEALGTLSSRKRDSGCLKMVWRRSPGFSPMEENLRGSERSA